MQTTQTIDTVVVGAGQAGLATTRELLAHGRECVVLERNQRVGEGWRRQYDSLRLFSPASHDGLPGMPFPGEPRSFPGKDAVADYLETYARHFELPVRLGVGVERVSRPDDDPDAFEVTTTTGRYRCRNVVVATGTLGRTPHVPDLATGLDPSVLQLHSSEYRRPGQLPDGPVLVVGASHSGCDIALELAPTRETHLAGRDHGQLPISWEGTGVHRAFPVILFVWQHVLTRWTPMGRRVLPEVRGGHGGPMLRVKREHLAERGVVRHLQRIESVVGGRPALTDGTVLDVAAVVWATGFRQRFDWLDLDVVGEDGWPREYRGVCAEAPGLYFTGLAFQSTFASMTLPGVGRDAAYVVRHLVGHRAVSPGTARVTAA